MTFRIGGIWCSRVNPRPNQDTFMRNPLDERCPQFPRSQIKLRVWGMRWVSMLSDWPLAYPISCSKVIITRRHVEEAKTFDYHGFSAWSINFDAILGTMILAQTLKPVTDGLGSNYGNSGTKILNKKVQVDSRVISPFDPAPTSEWVYLQNTNDQHRIALFTPSHNYCRSLAICVSYIQSEGAGVPKLLTVSLTQECEYTTKTVLRVLKSIYQYEVSPVYGAWLLVRFQARVLIILFAVTELSKHCFSSIGPADPVFSN
ncbi:uncharacterized protein BDR25DRAFT_364001 [Lindgomyces ingoldianus]|uniref:Uncharacterized protein n=1 Tax=Lindgomyces ingoldianus TaxID=673940 RepID=A0ACB6Q6R6_9PLEO|nr:uncharacterized protein BDR25DRAFT_364001 [Lindgomyces ingoldianus]KAF2462511.1 hypothetical protein BDR25DRAFT_364001 [Lindgomyces ingoldianus]